MRGASAIQEVLDDVKSQDIAVLVVWEPIIFSDVAPPTSRVLAKIHDTRATQFWDPQLGLSKRLKAAATAAGPSRPNGIPDEEGGPVWDFVGIYPPGPAWAEAPLGISFSGSPVVDVIAEVRRNLMLAPVDAAQASHSR